MLRFAVFGSIVGPWLALTPWLWDQRPERAFLAAATGLLAVVFATAAMWRPGLRIGLSFVALALTLSVFAFPQGIGSTAHDLVMALLLWVHGLFPIPRVVDEPQPMRLVVAAPVPGTRRRKVTQHAIAA
jgi:hypothetical protein